LVNNGEPRTAMYGDSLHPIRNINFILQTMAKRLTAKDLRSELQDLKMQKDGCEARIRRRATNLVKQFPDVQIGSYPVIDRYVPVYAKDYKSFDDRSISDALHVIETIEKHLESLHPHKQSKIEF